MAEPEVVTTPVSEVVEVAEVKVETPAAAPVQAVAETVAAPEPETTPEPAAEDHAKPRRKGWWSLGR